MDEEGFDTLPAIAHAEDDEHVGYGRPPVRTRFKPGQSGNPAGRPRGSRNSSPAREVERGRETALAAAYREISVMDGGRQRVATMLQAAWHALTTKAAKGEFRSIQYLIDKIGAIEKEQASDMIAYLRGAIKYQEDAYAEIERRERAGEAPLQMYPHPDDIRLDLDSGIVDIIGPREPADKASWDQMDAILLAEFRMAAEIKRLASNLEDEALPPETIERLRYELKVLKSALKKMEKLSAPMPQEDKAWRLRRLATKAGGGM